MASELAPIITEAATAYNSRDRPVSAPPTATEVLNELAALVGRNVGARACLRKFLDQSPVVAALNVDRVATSAAGETMPALRPI